MLRKILFLFNINILSKSIGYIRDLLLFTYLNINVISDFYFFWLNFIQRINAIFLGQHFIISMIITDLSSKNIQKKIFIIILIATSLLIFFLLLFNYQINSYLFNNIESIINYGNYLYISQILIVSLLFLNINAFFIAVNENNKNFTYPYISNIFINSLTILAILVFKDNERIYLYLNLSYLSSLIIICFFYKKNYKIYLLIFKKFKNKIKNSKHIKIYTYSLSLISIYQIIRQYGFIEMERYEKLISFFYIGERIVDGFATAIGLAFGTVLLSIIKTKKIDNYVIYKFLRFIFYLSIIIAIFLFHNSTKIIEMIFFLKKFKEIDLIAIDYCFKILVIGLPAYGLFKTLEVVVFLNKKKLNIVIITNLICAIIFFISVKFTDNLFGFLKIPIFFTIYAYIYSIILMFTLYTNLLTLLKLFLSNIFQIILCFLSFILIFIVIEYEYNIFLISIPYLILFLILLYEIKYFKKVNL